MQTRYEAVVLDVDGCLVDSVELHARAWSEALGEQGVEVPAARVRPLIGMSGSVLLPELGIDPEGEVGERAKARRKELFLERYLPRVEAFPGARELLEALRAKGLRLVVATGASEEEMGPLLGKLDADELIEEKTSADADAASKPAPDVVQLALELLGVPPGKALMIGDAPWDVQAAVRAGADAIALRTGDWDDVAYRGALAVYDDAAALLAGLERSPLA